MPRPFQIGIFRAVITTIAHPEVLAMLLLSGDGNNFGHGFDKADVPFFGVFLLHEVYIVTVLLYSLLQKDMEKFGNGQILLLAFLRYSSRNLKDGTIFQYLDMLGFVFREEMSGTGEKMIGECKPPYLSTACFWIMNACNQALKYKAPNLYISIGLTDQASFFIGFNFRMLFKEIFNFLSDIHIPPPKFK